MSFQVITFKRNDELFYFGNEQNKILLFIIKLCLKILSQKYFLVYDSTTYNIYQQYRKKFKES